TTTEAANLFAAGRAATEVVSSEVVVLTRGVLRAMRFAKIKTAATFIAAAVLALTIAGAGIWQAKTWAEGKPPVDNGFRVTVTDVIRDDSIIVTQIDLEVPPGSKVEIVPENGKGGHSFSSDKPGANGLCSSRVTLLADQVELKDGTSFVKFMIAEKIGEI